MTVEPLEIGRALTLGVNHVAGSDRHGLVAQKWWRAETFQVHGFEPGAVVPSTALVLAHKHPDDSARVSRTPKNAAATGEHTEDPAAGFLAALNPLTPGRLLR